MKTIQVSEMHVVYCPSVGYSLSNDTGKRFRFETEADHFVHQLRRKGLHAWSEVETSAPVAALRRFELATYRNGGR